jgi:hypothetical protein
MVETEPEHRDFKYAAFDDVLDQAEALGTTREEAIAEYISAMRLCGALERGEM